MPRLGRDTTFRSRPQGDQTMSQHQNQVTTPILPNRVATLNTLSRHHFCSSFLCRVATPTVGRDTIKVNHFATPRSVSRHQFSKPGHPRCCARLPCHVRCSAACLTCVPCCMHQAQPITTPFLGHDPRPKMGSSPCHSSLHSPKFTQMQ